MKSLKQFISEEMSAKDTLSFIKKAHAGQKYAPGVPYWKHPKEVADVGKKVFGSKFNDTAFKAALLHDVVEDTEYGIDDLRNMGFSEDVLNAVSLLTKDDSLNYKDNINRIARSGDRIAMMVKYADNYVNFHGDKSKMDPKRRETQYQKYSWSMNTLGKKLGVKSDWEAKNPNE